MYTQSHSFITGCLYFLRWGFSGASVGRELPCNPRDARDMGSIPGSGRSPGGGHGYSLQYSCLENLMDRGAWWATVHRLQRVGHDWSEWAQHILPYNDLNIIAMDTTPLHPCYNHGRLCFLHVSYAYMPLLMLSFLLGFLTHFVQVVTSSNGQLRCHLVCEDVLMYLVRSFIPFCLWWCCIYFLMATQLILGLAACVYVFSFEL